MTEPCSNSKRILLLQLKRIGDCILTAPAVAALRAQQPDAEIVAIVPDSVADLAACMPGLNRVLAYRGGSLNVAVWASLLVGEWDVCYDFTGTDRSALMAWLSRAKQSVGYAKFASDSWRARAYTELCDASVRELHTVDFHLALIGEMENGRWKMGDRRSVLHPPPIFHLPSSISQFCLVHIGTAREEKFWPAERWAEVIESLAKTHRIVLTGTNAGIERPHLDQLRSLLRVPFTDLTGQLSLVELAALIEHCDLALGVDSMAMHLAAMFGRPQVVLFGPTNPFHWRPRHDRAFVVAAGHAEPLTHFAPRAKGADMNLVSTAQVLSAIHRALFPTHGQP